jgi:hypothetical protein
MALLVHPQSELIREPRLLVPRMQPLGAVACSKVQPAPAWLYLLRPDQGFNRLCGSAGRQRLTPAAAAFKPNAQGIGAICSSNTRITYDTALPMIVTSNGSGTGDFSVLCVAAPIATATRRVIMHQRLDSGGQTESWLMAANMYYAQGASSSTLSSGAFTFMQATLDGTIGARNAYVSSGQADGNTHCWVGVRRSGVLELWRDGFLQMSTDQSSTIANVYGAAQLFSVGGWTVATDFHALEPIHMISGWNDALTQAQAAAISGDPYSLVSPA